MLVRTQIMLEEKQHRFLLEESRRKGISMSEVIRQLVNEKERELAKAQVKGAVEIAGGAVPGPDESIPHDEVLYK
jgi:predicted CopG family antitoxin